MSGAKPTTGAVQQDDTPKAKLLSELKKLIKHRAWWGNLYWNAAKGFSYASILASIAAGITAWTATWEPLHLALLAATPAAIVLFQQVGDFSELSRWHWKYHNKLEALRREVEYQNLDISEAAGQLSAIETEGHDQSPEDAMLATEKRS